MDTKLLFSPKKGKEPTKGQKKIEEDNYATVKFYSIMAAVGLVGKLIASRSISISLFLAVIVQATALYGMKYMSTGTDLNLPNSFADRVKDIVITTAACSLLSIISELFWLLWLWLPAYLIYTIWTTIVAPWIFQAPPEEVPEKKRKKQERKMIRASYGK